MSDLATKRTELDKLRREVMELEAKDRVENGYPKAKRLEGSYHKYRNSYSCPQKPEDYWWIHRHIRQVRRDGIMLVDRYEIDTNGELRISTGKEEPWGWGMDGWVESSAKEFRREAKRVKAIVSRLAGSTKESK